MASGQAGLAGKTISKFAVFRLFTIRIRAAGSRISTQATCASLASDGSIPAGSTVSPISAATAFGSRASAASASSRSPIAALVATAAPAGYSAVPTGTTGAVTSRIVQDGVTCGRGTRHPPASGSTAASVAALSAIAAEPGQWDESGAIDDGWQPTESSFAPQPGASPVAAGTPVPPVPSHFGRIARTAVATISTTSAGAASATLTPDTAPESEG